MYCSKIKIPKMSDNRKIYIYRAKNSESINTISKVKELNPVIVIDEATAETTTINGKEYYIVYDNPNKTQTGVTYSGPVPNIVPITEYETNIGIEKVNDFTYVNVLKLNELETSHPDGTMLYYSAIGIDEDTNLITHLSKVQGVLIASSYKTDARHLYSCNDYTGKDTDEWTYVSSIPWTEDTISIGNIHDDFAFQKYGNPFVETVPSINLEKIKLDTKPVINRNFGVLEIQNPWQHNNKKFNFRKLKSFKIQNTEGDQYSDFSEPTYQSELPVSIEKMVILKKTDSDNPESPISINDMDSNDIIKYEIIRKDGIYYSAKNHRKLGINKYNIPLGETTAVFSEGSVQDLIKIQIETLIAHNYSFTVYLIDVYGNISEPVVYQITT